MAKMAGMSAGGNQGAFNATIGTQSSINTYRHEP